MRKRPVIYDVIQDKLHQSAEKWVFRTIGRQLTDKEDTGAYVVAMDITDPTLPYLIGAVLAGFIVEPNNSARYLSLAQEKCTRLALHPEHISSAQSADESAGQYAGAVRSDRVIDGRMIAVGTSGLLAHADESISAMILLDCGLCSEGYLMTITSKSHNRILPQLF